MEVINPFMLIIMGLMFEIIGAFFLVSETYGKIKEGGIIGFLKKISIWAQKRMRNMILVLMPNIVLLVLLVAIKSNIIKGLLIPICFISIMIPVVIDHSDDFENWISKNNDKGKIDPFGFFLLLIGFILQLSGVIWQMILSEI